MDKNLTNLGYKVPQSVKDSFGEFCDRVGSRHQEDCAGALFLWPYLPAELREWAKLAAKGEGPAADESFWAGFAAAFRTISESLRADLGHAKPKGGKKSQ